MRWILFFIVLVMLASLATAASTINPLVDQITYLDVAEFELKISNGGSLHQRYSIYSLESQWTVDPSPLTDKIIELNPGQSKTIKLKVSPLEKFTPGIYYVSVNVESDQGEKETKSLKVYMSPDQPIDYLPAIKVGVDMDEKINPQQPVSIKLFLENRNPLDLTGLKIKIQSDMDEFLKEVNVDLPPLEKKTVEFTVTPNLYQQPKNYMIFFVFERNGQTVKVIDQQIEIVSLVPEFTQTINLESIYLNNFFGLTVTNEGNVKNTQLVKYPVSMWQGLFAQGEEDIIKEEGQRYLVWEKTLSPGESVHVDFLINYRILLYMLIVAIIFLSFYMYVQTPVEVIKKAVTTKSNEDGALSEIKVTLELRNKTKKPLKDVSITDVVPAIANVEKSLQLGTLRPEEIKHGKTGTMVTWNLAELDSHEHRLITYKLRAKLNILGTFSLPRATVEYKKKKGKGKAFSNIFRLAA